MNVLLNKVKLEVYDQYDFELAQFSKEPESEEYDACRFELNGCKIISRNAKITPKKVGQFVTFWKRIENGPIEPFQDSDPIDFFVVNVQSTSNAGQFVIPKSVLIQKGIISTPQKEGKRAFRVYPSWDLPTSKQAQRTQKWQMDYFVEINESMDFDLVKRLYRKAII